MKLSIYLSVLVNKYLGSDAVVKCKTIFMGYKENES
jgi:hypothetical protein